MLASRETVLIVGQGIAGTCLARVLLRQGTAFRVADAGHGGAASAAAAGLISPVLGPRWTRADARLTAEAVEFYRDCERWLGVPLLRPVRIAKAWGPRDDRERVTAKVGRRRSAGVPAPNPCSHEQPLARLSQVNRGELEPYVRRGSLSDRGGVVEGAWHLDMRRLIAGARARGQAEGWLEMRAVGADEAGAWQGPAIWCVGAAEQRVRRLVCAPAGALLVRLAAPMPLDTVEHDGFFLVPLEGGDKAWVGPSQSGEPDGSLREWLDRRLGPGQWTELEALRGTRAALSGDKRPVAEWISARGPHQDGVINGLGFRGAFLAPSCALTWAKRLAT
jgi:hypothetical protein